MFKCEYGTFVNDWGFNEKYIAKSIESRKTGHIYSGSAFETADSCGNCDGGRCNFCREVFTVTEFGEPIFVPNAFGFDEQRENILAWKSFTDRQEALDYYESL